VSSASHRFLTFISTGSVILGGFIAAAKRASEASGKSLKDHKVVFLGGGSAAIGVAKEMMTFFKMQGFTEEEARERFWLIDTKGLITATRPDVVAGKLASHKEYFIRKDNNGQEFKTLAEVVEYVKPTALVGLSTTFGAFTEDVVRRLAELNAAPIIFPLSNPTSKCELSFQDALNWTDGRVLFASGSPYDPITFKGQLREPGQGVSFITSSDCPSPLPPHLPRPP
jgi:malate dehydrogenase (oxaloacetate-decarboxylating)(NADP+)